MKTEQTTPISARGSVDMDTMPLGRRHIRIVLIASLGQFIGQGLATLVGIIIPLMQLLSHPELPAAVQGLMGCISLIGIMIGTVVFGRLSDRYGYLLFFRLCPAIIAAASVVAALWPSVPVVLVCLFVMGLAVGGEYSLDPDYISELMPVRWRIYMVGVATALASAGSAVVAAVCYVVITVRGEHTDWSSLFYIVTATALLMVATRMWFAQSPQWLMSHGRKAQAEAAVRRFLGPDVVMEAPAPAQSADTAADSGADESLWQFVKRNMARITLTGVPWACEGLGVYGIGIFLPVLIISFHLDSLPAGASGIARITNSVGLTFVLSLVMMAGFGCGLMMLKRFDHLRMQAVGFWMSAAGMGLLLAAYLCHWPAWVAICGFVVFEIFLNAGPHLITFILPGRVYPVADRGTGSGIAAGIGKTGAVAGAFIIPMLLKWGGATLVIIVSIVVMVAGALITRLSGNAVDRDSHTHL